MRRFPLRHILAASVTAASVIVIAPTTAVFAAPVPAATVTVDSTTPMVGETATFTVTFDNSSAVDAGYGPYVDLRLPIGGADGNDGISFASASYLGAPVSPLLTVSCTGTAVTHPLTGASVSCPAGQQLVVVQLPFGSFTPTQPPAPLTVVTAVSDLADVGTALTVSATPGFAYGATAVGNSPIIGAAATVTVTPQIVRFTTTYLGPEQETATGPNYPRRIRLSVDIATAQQVSGLAITDLLPPEYAFLAVTATGPAGSTPNETPTVGSPALAPNNDLVRTWTGNVTGTAATEDMFVEFEYFVVDTAATGAAVLEPVTGDDHLTRNDAKVSGTTRPKDVRDPAAPFTIDPNTTGGKNPDDLLVTAKSIAVQKSVSIATDLGATGASPDDVLRYTISGQISDYFTFGDVRVVDVLGDGQTFSTAAPATITITENGVSTTTDLGTTTTLDESQRATCGDGTTTAAFDVSGAYAASGTPNGASGIFTGGRVAAPTGPATFTITYLATIDDRFRCAPGQSDALDPLDHVDNAVSVTGEVYDNTTQAPQTIPQFESDTSGASTVIRDASLSKSVYARNGVIGGASGSPAQFAAGDTITYRLHFDMPTTDITGFDLTDYLPLPVLVATGLQQTAGACTTPVAGEWCYGPADTFHSLPGAPAPTVNADAVGNSISFHYGTYDDPGNQATTVELLFTLRISESPFRDGLFLTNQLQAVYSNSFGVQQTAPAIVQIELTEPNLRIVKGVVNSDGPSTTYSGTRNPTGITFGAVGASCPGFSPASLTSSKLNGAPNANATRVDADDLVRFAIVVENTGKGLRGAYDVTVGDSLPAGLSIPAGGLRLCVSDGLGNALAHDDTGFFTGTPSTGAATGTITLVDGANGALTPDNPGRTAGTNLAVISYELQVDSSTGFQTTLTNTATISHFSATEGGPDFTPLLPALNASDSATVTTRTPTLVKTLESTNQAHTAGNTVVIGEEATYKVVVTVPEGRSLNTQLVDTLPAGLALTGVDSIVASLALTSSVGSMATVLSTTQAALAAPGRPLTIALGTLTNSDTDDAVAETITVVYRAVALDVAGNQGGTSVSNSVRLTYTGGNSAAATATVVVAEPTLHVTKTASPATADAGDTVTYTILVQHLAGSSVSAFDAALTDLVPAGVNYVAGSLQSTGSFAPTTLSDAAAPSLSATWSTFPVGSTSILTYQAVIPANATAPASVANTARLTWTSLPVGGDPVSPYNTNGRERTGAGGVDDYADTSTATVAITAASISKSLVSTSAAHTTAADVTIGETVTYDVRVTLPEGNIPSGLVVTDALPIGLQYEAGSAQVITTGFNGTLPSPTVTGGATDGADVTLTFGATSVAANNDPADNSFVVRVTATVTDVPSNVGIVPGQTALDNTATVQLTGGSLITSNVVRTTVVEPKMSISKTVSPTIAIQGDLITISFVVENVGLADAFDVNVRDVLDVHYDASTSTPVSTPAGFTFSRQGSTITYSGGTIPDGESRTFVMTAQLVSPLPAGTLVPNTATVTDATTLPGIASGERNEPDVSSQANLNSVAPDLVLSKDDGVATVVPGDDVTYQLLITNVGGFQAKGVAIADTLPAGLSFVSVGGARCTDAGESAGVRRITVSGVVAANGGTVTCTLTAHVDSPAAAGTAGYRNTATATDDGTSGADPTPDNNSNDDLDTLVGHVPDLSVSKHDGVQTRAPGETYTYTVHAQNNGNIGVTNVQVTDTLPQGLSFVSCTSTSGVVAVACAESGGTVTITYAVLAGNGGSASFELTVTVVNPVASGVHDLVNHVGITDDGANGTDANPADNVDTDTDVLDAAPDLLVVKHVATSQAAPGDVVDYTLLAANEGLQDATGTVVSDQAPVGLTIQCPSAIPAATSCDGSTIVWGPGLADTGATTGGIFRAGHQRTFTYRATVDAPALAGTTDLVNTATVDDDHANGVDPTPADNSDTATVTLVGAAPDLSISKDDGATTVRPGDATTYTITITNNGNIGASGVVVTDTLPPELRFVACPTTPVACDTSGLPVIRWTLPVLAGGAVAEFSLDTAVLNPIDAGVSSITNPVRVDDDHTNGADPTPDDNAAADTDQVLATPDLDITKDDGVQIRQPGDEYDYSLLVRNKGDQAATGAQVTDQLPAELVFVSCPATPVPCTHSGEDAGGTVSWTLPDLPGGADQPSAPAGSAVTLLVHVRVAGAVVSTVDQIHNVASVHDDGSNGVDPTPTDNADSDTDTLSVAPDMTITKTDGVDTARPGDTLAYVIEVHNQGTQAATGVTVQDVLPAGVTFVSCSGNCDATSLPTLTWTDLMEDTPGSVADPSAFDPAGAATLTVTVTVDDPAAPGLDTLQNVATVNDDGLHGVDPTPENNSASDIDTLDTAPDLVVTKDDGVASALDGDRLDYTITITNVGHQTATGVAASDALPVGTTFESCTAACTTPTSSTVEWAVGSLAAGERATVHVVVTVDAPVAAGVRSFDNTVVAHDDGTNGNDPTPENNTATDRDTYGVDLGVTKSDGRSTVVPGSTVDYTITVTNHGPSTVDSFTLTDELPSALHDVRFRASRGRYDPATHMWQGLGAFAEGDEVTLHVTAVVDPAATGTITNRATVAPPTGFPDRDPSNDLATDTDRLTPRADLVLVKELMSDLTNGAEVRYELTVRNRGTSSATGVTIRDTMPSTLTPTRSAGEGWTCTMSGQVVDCALDHALAPNTSATVELWATVQAADGVAITNSAIAASMTPGPNGKPVTAVDGARGIVVNSLPVTGSDALGLLRLALELLFLGTALLRVRRPRAETELK